MGGLLHLTKGISFLSKWLAWPGVHSILSGISSSFTVQIGMLFKPAGIRITIYSFADKSVWTTPHRSLLKHLPLGLLNLRAAAWQSCTRMWASWMGVLPLCLLPLASTYSSAWQKAGELWWLSEWRLVNTTKHKAFIWSNTSYFSNSNFPDRNENSLRHYQMLSLYFKHWNGDWLRYIVRNYIAN